jgi:uncharacterized protein YxjI
VKANNNSSIGTVKRTFHLLRANYDIENSMGKNLIKIRGPFIFLPFIDREFIILKNEKEVGKIVKKWKGIWKEYFSDADSFSVSIDPGLPVPEKLLLFGAVFLIDFVSFENNQK